MPYDKIRLEFQAGVAIITLNDPATLNAAGRPMVQQLRDALHVSGLGESGARAIVITGEGRGFCSGANLQADLADDLNAGGRLDAGALVETLYNPLVTAIRNSPIPVVTAVNGVAAGVGCSIALLGDLIVAGESAYFLQAFRRIGLAQDGGSSYILPRLIGKARAMEMALLGEKIPADQALAWGLINRCVPDAQLMSTALGIAGELARGPASLGLIRKAIWAALDADWDGQLAHERDSQQIASETEDFREGVGAFLGKRTAAFRGV